MEKESEIIDFILGRLSISEIRRIDSSEIKEKFKGFNLEYFNYLIPKMDKELGLISRENFKGQTTHKMARLTKLGVSIVNSGGWIKFLDSENKTKIRKERKEYYDFKVSKWKHHTFWIVLVFGLFGGVYSFLDLINSTLNKEDKLEKIHREDKKLEQKSTQKNQSFQIDSLNIQEHK